ncbi:MAG: hypothetical protein AAF633_25325, partial [Chloroflexota bacterium]
RKTATQQIDIPCRFGTLRVFEHRFLLKYKNRTSYIYKGALLNSKLLPAATFTAYPHSFQTLFLIFVLGKNQYVEFSHYPTFAHQFHLTAEDQLLIQMLFSDQVINWFMAVGQRYVVECRPDYLLIYYFKKGPLLQKEVEAFHQDVKELARCLIKSQNEG